MIKKIKIVLALKHSDVIMLINVKMPTVVGILTFIIIINTSSELSLKKKMIYNLAAWITSMSVDNIEQAPRL